MDSRVFWGVLCALLVFSGLVAVAMAVKVYAWPAASVDVPSAVHAPGAGGSAPDSIVPFLPGVLDRMGAHPRDLLCPANGPALIVLDSTHARAMYVRCLCPDTQQAMLLLGLHEGELGDFHCVAGPAVRL